MSSYTYNVNLSDFLSFLRAMRDVGALKQSVVVTGASPWFATIGTACANIFEWIESRRPEGEFLPYEPLRGVDSKLPCFVASTPLLTSVRAGTNVESVPAPTYMKEYIQAVSSERYAYTAKNQVLYLERKVGKSVEFTDLDPKLFRHGHLVDVEVCFRGVRLRSGKRIFINHLSSLSLLDRSASIVRRLFS